MSTPAFELNEYSIWMGPLQTQLAEWFKKQQYSAVFTISDQHTKTACLPLVLEALGQTALPGVVIPPGEAYKSVETCKLIWDAMLAAGLDRKALVLNVGGGVIGDMGGFCAATFKRGLDFVQIPTSLLAMTDASVGGKLGIDFSGIKNAIGLFGNPVAVFVDPAFLKTLPAGELRSGLGEVLKHALIAAPNLWRTLLSCTDPAQLPWEQVLHQSIAVKVRVVQLDPLERGLRALLNFGHSIGHAVESYWLETESPIPHGEAVVIGMYCECLLDPISARHLPLLQLLTMMQRFFSLKPIPESAFPSIWASMQQDKKNTSGKVRIALPDAQLFGLQWLEATYEGVERSLTVYNDTMKAGLHTP